MRAAVRPTAGLLRTTRHAHLSRSLPRRWQTTSSRAPTFEDMLARMEAEYPDPAQPKSHRIAPRPNPQPTQQQSRLSEQPDDHIFESEQDYNYLPRRLDKHSNYHPVQPSTQPEPQTPLAPYAPKPSTKHHDTTRQPTHDQPPIGYHDPALAKPPNKKKARPAHERNDESRPLPLNRPLGQRPKAPNNLNHKPRPVPPPTYKTTDQHIHNKPPNGSRLLPYSVTPDPPSTPSTATPVESTPSPSNTPVKSSPKPSTTPVKSSPNPSSTTVKPPRTAVARPPPPSAPSALVEPHVEPDQEEPPLKNPLNPLETVEIMLRNHETRQDRPKAFDNLFLRDSCRCPQCVDPSTRQKRFDTSDIPSNIRVRSLSYDGGDAVLTWKHDVAGYTPDHVTRLSREWLRNSVRTPPVKNHRLGKHAWDTTTFTNYSTDIDFNEYMSDDKALFELLRRLHVFGLVFLTGVPENESGVIQTANRIGPLKNTFYGDTWDVRSVSNAKNVAYTDIHLGFHMDLLYMQQPPRMQLLHCLRASTEGGVSLFSDSYQAAETMHKMDFEGFQNLLNMQVNYHYDNDNHHYFQSRRTFEIAQGFAKDIKKDDTRVWEKLDAVNWSPPFQAPFHGTRGATFLARNMRDWHKAAQVFRDLTEMDSAVYKRQMKPGECVIFDNRRVLHARTAFAGGERWLRGAYLDDDPYLSKCRVLERKFGGINSEYNKPTRGEWRVNVQ